MSMSWGEEVVKMVKTYYGEGSYTQMANGKSSSRSGFWRILNRKYDFTLNQLIKIARDYRCEFRLIVRAGPIPVTITIHHDQNRQP